MHFASFSVSSNASLYGFSVMFHPPFPSEISSAFNLCPYQSSTMACLSSPESTGKPSCYQARWNFMAMMVVAMVIVVVVMIMIKRNEFRWDSQTRGMMIKRIKFEASIRQFYMMMMSLMVTMITMVITMIKMMHHQWLWKTYRVVQLWIVKGMSRLDLGLKVVGIRIRSGGDDHHHHNDHHCGEDDVILIMLGNDGEANGNAWWWL